MSASATLINEMKRLLAKLRPSPVLKTCAPSAETRWKAAQKCSSVGVKNNFGGVASASGRVLNAARIIQMTGKK